MRALVIVPGQVATGEAFTALDTARELVRRGGVCALWLSPLAARIVGGEAPGRVWTADDSSRARNALSLREALDAFRPDVALLADLSNLSFSSGTIPLPPTDALEILRASGVRVATFDHLGLEQRDRRLFFGPPHLTFHQEAVAGAPADVEILLPSPINGTSPAPGRRGRPVRVLPPPGDLVTPSGPRRARERVGCGPDRALVLHALPRWAVAFSETLGLGYGRHVPDLLAAYLAPIGRRVLVVSTAAGPGRREAAPGVDVVTLPEMSRAEFTALVAASDLFVTENSVSSALGLAVHLDRPAALLRNRLSLHEALPTLPVRIAEVVRRMEAHRPGSIFRFECFPILGAPELAELGVWEGNDLAPAVARVELLGGRATTEALGALLTAPRGEDALAAPRHAYRVSAARLGHAVDALAGSPQEQGAAGGTGVD